MKCIFLTETDQAEVSVRRFAYSERKGKCQASGMGAHDASGAIGRRPVLPTDARGDNHPHDDARWPARCACGYEFAPDDQWQCNPEVLYRRSDNGELVTLRNAPIGAMWFADWLSDCPEYAGPDGNTLIVRLPGRHDWTVDGRASNCDSPCSQCSRPYHAHAGGRCNGAVGYRPDCSNSYRDARPHKCWVRHGAPPDVHVDKAGITCGAGAGSIAVAGYHGFLHRGCLTDC